MSWRVEFETRARREYLDLPGDVQERLADAIDDLAKDPRPPGCKRLKGQDGYRIRKGDYRILYTVNDARRVVQVYRIGNRRDVYRGDRKSVV